MLLDEDDSCRMREKTSRVVDCEQLLLLSPLEHSLSRIRDTLASNKREMTWRIRLTALPVPAVKLDDIRELGPDRNDMSWNSPSTFVII